MAQDIKIRVRGLYKIFGQEPVRALKLVRNGVGKRDLLETHGHVLALQDINVEVAAGKITVIMGLSGSGKSTLIRHLNRLIEPTIGEILIDGQDVLAYPRDAIRGLRRTKMSMVFQKFGLLPHRTILQNVCLAPHIQHLDKAESELAAASWLERVGLKGYEAYYPYQLSGGMQQRVGIARALTSNADVMLMDEAFSALDPLIRNDMQNLLLELQSELKKTIVFITHDLDEALKLADHLVILKDGTISQQGDPQHILLNPADQYVGNFVSEINRARVLRVRSIMSPLGSCSGTFAGEVDGNDTLEQAIALSGGDTAYNFRVVSGGSAVGELEMTQLVRALVPRNAGREPITATGQGGNYGLRYA